MGNLNIYIAFPIQLIICPIKKNYNKFYYYLILKFLYDTYYLLE